MSDEENSIEEIIAELESLENQAKDEEEKQAAPNTDEMPEELTLEEPGEHIFSEDPLSPPVEVKAEQSEYEDIFAEKPPEKPRIEIEIEEVSDEISLKEAIEKKPSDAVPSDEHVIGELSLQEHVEELSLDEPTDIHTKEDEDVIEFSQDNIDEEKREETHGSEISLETEDISLMELSSEGPREEPTVDISSDIVRDDKSFEIGSMEQDADTVTPKEPSFDDAFDGTGGDSSSEASQEVRCFRICPMKNFMRTCLPRCLLLWLQEENHQRNRIPIKREIFHQMSHRHLLRKQKRHYNCRELPFC